MSSFLTSVDNVLVHDRIDSVLTAPLAPPVPHGHSDPGADMHIRIPKSLADEIEAIAGAYPTSRNNLVRVFLTLAAKEWRAQQKQALESSKPAIEKARARKLGANRNK